MREPDTSDVQFLAVNTAASGSASTVTLPTPASTERNVIDAVYASCSVAPTGGVIITITNVQGASGAVTWSQDITAAGPAPFYFREPGLRGILGAAMVISMTDGTTAKDLNVAYR